MVLHCGDMAKRVKPAPEIIKTLDEIVADNLKALLERLDWSVPELAESMDVPRQLVYDFIRPRGNRGQRPFRWTELVAICTSLQVSLEHLVLPPEGVGVARPARESDILDHGLPPSVDTIGLSVDSGGEPGMWGWIARDALSYAVFGDALTEGVPPIYLKQNLEEVQAKFLELSRAIHPSTSRFVEREEE